MNAKDRIIKTYQMLKSIGHETDGFVKIIDIINMTDIPAAQFQSAISEMNKFREGWYIIPNSQGGDVTPEERKHCPWIGNQQVHLIKW